MWRSLRLVSFGLLAVGASSWGCGDDSAPAGPGGGDGEAQTTSGSAATAGSGGGATGSASGGSGVSTGEGGAGGGSTADAGASGTGGAQGGGGSTGVGGGAPDLCAEFPAQLAFDLPYGNGETVTTAALGGFAFDAVIVARLTVPADAVTGPALGSVVVAEYQGPPTARVLTLSPLPCDFRGLESGRPTDPTGATAPLAWGLGGTASASFVVGAGSGGAPSLQPGGTYYVNVRNYSVDLHANSCAEGTSCDAILVANPPAN